MVYGNIKEIKKYATISKWFLKAADFLESTELSDLPLGKTVICEDHVFINVMEVETQSPQNTHFEVHKKYWDVQIDIEGTETIQVGLDSGKLYKEYDENADIGFYDCEDYLTCVMGPGRFIICMDSEPHKPTLDYHTTHKIRKCVIKVEVD